MDIQQLMQILQGNPQLLMQLIQALMQAGIVAPGPKMQGMGGGRPQPGPMQPTPGGGPAGAAGGPGVGIGRAAMAAGGGGRPSGLMR
jgi:hypothetical protein